MPLDLDRRCTILRLSFFEMIATNRKRIGRRFDLSKNNYVHCLLFKRYGRRKRKNELSVKEMESLEVFDFLILILECVCEECVCVCVRKKESGRRSKRVKRI